MTETALDLLQQAVSSPWLYLVLFALAAFDGVVPMIPGETALVTAAVFAASGTSNLALIILAGSAGAFVGDHTAYLLGRLSIARFTARSGNPRTRSAYDWARRQLAARGGQVLLASRYVPGVRTATTLLLGGVRYPIRSFALFDSAAALFWAGGWSLIGFLGGAAFEGEPLKGLLLGIGLAVTCTLLGELGRRLWRRRPAARYGGGAPSDAAPGDTTPVDAEPADGASVPGEGARPIH